MLPAFTKMTLVLESPKSCKDFESRAGQKWARDIIVDYYTRTEEGWLLGPLVKMLSVIAKENPTPGGLSRSYCLEVFFKIGETMSQEHWFVKIPRSLQTVAMDERELVMYNTIFPRLQRYLSETLDEDVKVDLPIPIIYFSSFMGDGIHDCLVTENLCSSRYFQVDRDTTKLAYMRAAMHSLANVHGITFSFMKSLGGKEALLREFPTIKEQLLSKDRKVKRTVEKCILPFLVYMARIKPDISQQIQVLSKFSKFLYKVYSDLQDKDELKQLGTLVHGDAKLDNFLFRKEGWGEEDKFSSMLIDWQGCGFDLVSNDLMWCLYGFIKNLPETGEMIHGFVEYSLVTYWDSLKQVLKAFGDSCSDFSIPEDSEWAAELIKEGFTLEFMKNAIIRPCLCLKNKDLLLEWFQKLSNGSPDEPPPPETEIFKSDTYANFIYLFFKIGTEVNVFSHLGKVLFMHMKEAMFSEGNQEDDEDTEDEEDGQDGADKNGEKEEPDKTKDENPSPEHNGDQTPGQENGDEHKENGVSPEDQFQSALNSLQTNLENSLENARTLNSLNLPTGLSDPTHRDSVERCRSTLLQLSVLCPVLFPVPEPEQPKTVTSMYGKVYNLKKS